MAVVGSAELIGDPTGSFELGKYEIRVPYRVVVDSGEDGPLIVCSAAGLPAFYDSYSYGNESDPLMLLRRYEPERIGDHRTNLWKVVVVYSTPDQKEGKGDSGDTGGGTGRETPGEFEDPTLEIPTLKMTSSSRERPLTMVRDNLTNANKPCTASNGQVFDPPPKTLETLLLISITRNEPITNDYPNIAVLYTNAVNSDVFFGINAGLCKIKDILVERQERQIKGGIKFPYLRVTYNIEVNPDGWDDRLLDYGDFFWPAPSYPPNAAITPTKILTADGHPTAAPLNGRGLPLLDRRPFTADSGADTLTIAAGSSLADGDLIQVSNVGGALPAPLREGATYYVIGKSGNSFKLASAVRNVAIKSAENASGLPGQVLITTTGPHGLSGADNIIISDVQTIFTLSGYPEDVFGLNGSYSVTNVFDSTKFSITVALDPEDLYMYGGVIAKPVDLTTVGSGTNVVWSPGVFFTIRKFRFLPYAFLQLPNSFAEVQ